MVKATNNSADNSVPVSSCVTAKQNGFSHLDKPTRSMSIFSKPLKSLNTLNDINSSQSNSSKSYKDHDRTDKSNIFNSLSKNDGFFYSKSPSASPEKQQLVCSAINGHKASYAAGSPKWTEMMRNRPCYSSPEQSPTKTTDSDTALFNISKRKSQPILYRKMFGVYKENHEVLARWSDGLYYLGTIRQVSLCWLKKNCFMICMFLLPLMFARSRCLYSNSNFVSYDRKLD